MGLRQQLLLLLASSGGSYVCLEFLFIEESVKIMQGGRVLLQQGSLEFALAAPFW